MARRPTIIWRREIGRRRLMAVVMKTFAVGVNEPAGRSATNKWPLVGRRGARNATDTKGLSLVIVAGLATCWPPGCSWPGRELANNKRLVATFGFAPAGHLLLPRRTLNPQPSTLNSQLSTLNSQFRARSFEVGRPGLAITFARL